MESTNPSMSVPRISVIIPVYNVEAYLPECLSCLHTQTYRNLEIILIDDASDDTSGQLCDAYAATDTRAKVIHQPHAGLSAARNRGVAVSTGEYLCFIDSDDVVAPDYAEYLFSLLRDADADMSMARYAGFTDIAPTMAAGADPYAVHTYTGRQAVCLLLGDDHIVSTVVWGKLYRRSLFDGGVFPEGRKNEDEAVSYRLYWNASRVVFSDRPLYGYRQRAGSIMAVGFNRQQLHFLHIAKERAEFFLRQGDIHLYEQFLRVYAYALLSYAPRTRSVLHDRKLARLLKKHYRTTERKLRGASFPATEKFTLWASGRIPRLYRQMTRIRARFHW